jgi:hypothetical protein
MTVKLYELTIRRKWMSGERQYPAGEGVCQVGGYLRQGVWATLTITTITPTKS